MQGSLTECKHKKPTPRDQCHLVTSTPDASMTDLSIVLPCFPTDNYMRLIPSLEKNLVSTTDLLTLDANEIAKHAHLPVQDVKRLCNAVLRSFQASLSIADAVDAERDALHNAFRLRNAGNDLIESWMTISTLDDTLDVALGGGIPTGYVTEVTGERWTGPRDLQWS